MKLKLIRTKFYQECTHGALYIDGEYFCDTLEPHRIDWSCQRKMMGQTAIAEGTYRIVIGMSARFRRMMPYLCDVPQFTGVMIHPGNSSRDTAGCILVGTYVVRNFICRSTPAFNTLYDRLAHAYSAGEEITISVE